MATIALPQVDAVRIDRTRAKKRLSPWQAVGLHPARAVRRSCSSCSCCTRSATACGSRGIRQSYVKLVDDPVFSASVVNTLVFLVVAINLKMIVGAGPVRASSCTARPWIKWLSLLFILPWAVPSIPTILSIRFMLNPEWGVINSLIFRLTGADGPNWLNDPLARAGDRDAVHIWKSLPFWTLILIAGRLAIPAEQYEAASVDGATELAEVPLHHVAVDAHAVPHVARSCR